MPNFTSINYSVINIAWMSEYFNRAVMGRVVTTVVVIKSA